MSDLNVPATRRGFLATAATAAVASALPFSRLEGAVLPGPMPSSANPDAWIDGLKGSHRMIFDSPQPNGGIMLIHMLNFYNTYNQAYGAADSDVNGIGGLYGFTTFHGLNDAMWAKYKLGAVVNETDPDTKQPALKNPWRTNPEILGMRLAPASIESLQKRGATFILCNNALTFLSGLAAKQQGLDGTAVYEDMKANMLPGVILVPGMVCAIDAVQKAGVSYHRQ